MISASLLRSGGFSSSSLVVDVGVGGAGVFLPLVPPPTDCDLSQPTSEGSGRGRPGGRPLGGPRLNFILREEKEGDEKRARTRWSGRRATLPPSALRPPPRRLALLLQALSLLFSRFLPLSFLLLLSPKCSVLPSPLPPPPSGSGRDRLRIKPCFGVPRFFSLRPERGWGKVARARKKGSKNIFRALPYWRAKSKG